MTSALGWGRGTVPGGGIQIGQVPVVDVREPMTAQRGRPLSLLASLSNVQGAAPIAGLQWLVKDLAQTREGLAADGRTDGGSRPTRPWTLQLRGPQPDGALMRQVTNQARRGARDPAGRRPTGRPPKA